MPPTPVPAITACRSFDDALRTGQESLYEYVLCCSCEERPRPRENRNVPIWRTLMKAPVCSFVIISTDVSGILVFGDALYSLATIAAFEENAVDTHITPSELSMHIPGSLVNTK